MSKHIFAIFYADLPKLEKLQIGSQFKIGNYSICNRINKVLRLKAGQRLILFNDVVSCKLEIVAICRSNICTKIIEINSAKPKRVQVDLLLPVLKRKAFEKAVYFAAEVGVSNIIPLKAEKSYLNWWHDDIEGKVEPIIIAAREQAKNFSSVAFSKEIDFNGLEKKVSEKYDFKIAFDLANKSFLDLLNQIKNLSKTKDKIKILVTVGPEGGFSSLENEVLDKLSFEKVQLTQTILQSPEAVLLGCGGLLSI